MSIPKLCTHCKKAPIVKSTREDSKAKVEYECGSELVYDESQGPGLVVYDHTNKCTFIPPTGVSANPDDWTDFYKTETSEKSAYIAHIAMMGERLQWLHELGDAYKALVEDLSKHQPLELEALLLLQTCITCRTELITAFRALARGYSTDCLLRAFSLNQ